MEVVERWRCAAGCPVAELDQQSGNQRDGVAVNRNRDPRATRPGSVYNGGWSNQASSPDSTYGGTGGASRFFYTAKADAQERPRVNGVNHSTVKPLDLMRWLVRLVTPPGGVVLDPFAGSGATVEACILEGFQCIGIEREPDYMPLIMQRINRRRDPVAAVRAAKAPGDPDSLFDLFDGAAD
jgi:site-specific DNA-methyltransferase (adenine-specific)